MKKYFVTGIGTDIGKTIVSAILVELLNADYWKPIQAGNLDGTDTMKVRQLVSNTKSIFHPEAYRLNSPLSPHAAAKIDGITIDIDRIKMPESGNETLLIEGAGGVMVPLTEKDLVIDIISHLKAEVILVSKNYLGSINHTLLSAAALKSRGIEVKGIIFNGLSNPESEQAILHFSGLKKLLHIPELKEVTTGQIRMVAEGIKKDQAEHFKI